jgi:hypothetical protein
MRDLQLSVNRFLKYMKNHILSFNFFESKYLKSADENEIPKKYEFSCLLAFLSKFVDFTFFHIQQNY